jgi:hypothetical protein
MNPWVVNFEEGTETWEMKASADQPLEVHNLALGYKLFFYIVQFEIHKTKVIILGDARFELMKPSSAEEEKAWKDKRQDTYLGTERHLFNTMILGLAERQGFRIYSERSKKRVALVRSAYFKKELDKTLIPYTIRIIPFHGKVTLFQIPIRGRLEIHYINKKTNPFYDDVQDQVSWIETDEEAILVSESGVPQEPGKMILLGYWSEQRAADMLPLDYIPTK